MIEKIIHYKLLNAMTIPFLLNCAQINKPKGLKVAKTDQAQWMIGMMADSKVGALQTHFGKYAYGSILVWGGYG